MEPREITNPILKVGNHKEISRNDSIYGALVKSCEACHSLDAQKIVVEDIKSGVQKNWNTISDIMEYQINQKWAIKDINQEILNVKADILKSKEVADRRFKVVI